MKIDRDNCLRLLCEVKTDDHWVSFLGYHFNFSYWLDYSYKKRGKFKLQYIQYTERILKESDQSVYHSVY